MLNRLLILVSSALFVLGCGSKNTLTEFNQESDKDVGEGISPDMDAGTDPPVTGDPCQGENPFPCDPVADTSITPPSNPGCEAANTSCDFWDDGNGATLLCLSDATEEPGEPCHATDGPWCRPGATCLVEGDAGAGICVEFCCDSSQCTDQCINSAWSQTTGTLGYCDPDTQVTDPDGGADPDASTDAG